MARNPRLAVTLKLLVDIPDSEIENVEQNFADEGFKVVKRKQASGSWSLAAMGGGSRSDDD